MLTFSAARSLMESARSPDRGKPLQNNTRLYERTEFAGGGERTYYAVQLHSTDVVDILPNGHYRLNTGGWYTVTTRDRINGYAPTRHLRTYGGEWAMTCRPKASDPEPPFPEREIPKPYVTPDPGPEPVKSEEGCIAGTRYGVTTYAKRHKFAKDILATVARSPEIPAEIVTDGWESKGTNRARAVLAYLDTMEKNDYAFVDVWTWETKWTVYGEESWRGYGHDASEGKYEQCPHCKAHDRAHAQWRTAMHGSWGRHSNPGYERMCEMLETFGSREGWQEAYIEEFRAVREARRVHRAWVERNVVPFQNGIEIDSEGYPLRRESERIFKERRAYERRQRKLERARAAQERERRQVEKFKARMQAKRGVPFERAASEVAADLRELRLVVNNTVRPDDSQEVA